MPKRRMYINRQRKSNLKEAKPNQKLATNVRSSNNYVVTNVVSRQVVQRRDTQRRVHCTSEGNDSGIHH